MKHWPAQDAKARFSELLRASLNEGPQMVTLRGQEAAVLVPADEWKRLQKAGKPTLKDILLGDGPRDLELPEQRPLLVPRHVDLED
jgi:antitoxin Phd